MCLPDIGLVHGRMIVTAWDFGLDDVDDTAVKLVMEGVQVSGTFYLCCGHLVTSQHVGI